MNIAIYRLLNALAKAWWYHTDLRSRGNSAEARRRERRSITHWAESLRETIQNHGYLHIAPNGTTMHHADTHRTTCDWPDPEMLALAQACRIPILDTRTIPEEKRWQTLQFPAIGLTHIDPHPWTAFSRAPRDHVFALYEALGATIS